MTDASDRQVSAMNEIIDALQSRRSIRSFTDQSVSRATIEEIVGFGRLAATAMNEQPWEFVVVTERERLQKLPKILGHAEFIASAAACIIVLCRNTKHYLEDGCAASEQILLATHAYGLGACWVAAEKESYADQVREFVDAPVGYKAICLIPVGYPAEHPSIEKRTVTEVLHWEKF
jgi:nitroreductase